MLTYSPQHYQPRQGLLLFAVYTLLHTDRTASGSSVILILRASADNPAELRQNQPEANVVVVVRRVVVVPVRRTAVPGVVVPAATANHTVRACQDTAPYRCITFFLNDVAAACLVKATSVSTCLASTSSDQIPDTYFRS